MLEPQDLEAIRAIIREEIENSEREKKLEHERELHAERQRRYRERKRVTPRDGSVTQSDAIPEGRRDGSVTVRDGAPGKNGSHAGSSPSLPLFPLSDSPSLSPSSPTPPTNKNIVRARNRPKPESLKELKDYCVSIGLPEADAVCLWEHWIGNGFTNNGNRINDWKGVVSNWERRGIFFPSRKLK